MKREALYLFLILTASLLRFPYVSGPLETTTTAIETPFECRYLDIDDNGVLYAIDYNGTVWSYNTTLLTPSWNLEIVTSNTSESQYNTLWISPYWNYSVFVASTNEGIWKRNASGWTQVNDYAVNNIPYLPWHWTENPLNGTLYLQSHWFYIYNSTDGGDTWNLFYNMTASDNTYYAGTIDDHFHGIGFDNETQALWASGGDSRDVLRRYNSSGQWEIVGIDAGNTGGLGNLYQPTSLCFDDTYVYFGPDAGTKAFRVNKTLTSSELPLDVTSLEIEVILSLETYPYPENQWIFECRFIDDVLYMPTCYNDGIMLTSINGVEWINVFESDGYYLPTYGTPADVRAIWKGGISSITHRSPVYFVHNLNVYRLNLDSDDFRHLYNEPFITNNNRGNITVNRPVTTGSGYIGLGQGVIFNDVNMSLVGLSVYEVLENRTLEFGANESWTEVGYGDISVVSDDKHGGTYSLKDIVGNGTTGASLVYPPDCQSETLTFYGAGQYFFSVWLKTNVTWTETPLSPEFYLRIGWSEGPVGTGVTTRINITTSWTQFYTSAYLPSNAGDFYCRIDVYRENNTVRTVWIDDAMMWGPIRFSYVDSDRQHFISPAYTNSWGIAETRRDTENVTIAIGGVNATYQNVLVNGTSVSLGSLISGDLTYRNIIPYSVTVLNSSQALVYMDITYTYPFTYVPITFLFWIVGLVMMFAGPFMGIKHLKKGDYREGLIIITVLCAMGFSLLLGGMFSA